MKSCRPWIVGHTGERESDQNNRITGKLTVLKGKWRTIHRLKTLWATRKLTVLLLRIKNACISERATLLNLIILRYLFFYFFVIFWYPSWLEQTSPSNVLLFFSRKDIVHWSDFFSPDKVIPFCSLLKKFQLPRTNVLWLLTFQSWVVLMGWGQLNCSALDS